MGPGATRQVDYDVVCGNCHRNFCGGIRHRLQRRAGSRCSRAGGGNCRAYACLYPDGCANRYGSAHVDASTDLDANPYAGANLDTAANLDAVADGYPAPHSDSDATANLHALADRYSDSPKTGSYAALPQCARWYVFLGKRSGRFLDNVSR